MLECSMGVMSSWRHALGRGSRMTGVADDWDGHGDDCLLYDALAT